MSEFLMPYEAVLDEANLSSGTPMGLPAGLVTGVDRAMYIADDSNGFIYRVAPRLPAEVGGGAPDGVGRSGVLWR